MTVGYLYLKAKGKISGKSKRIVQAGNAIWLGKQRQRRTEYFGYV